jgi:mRNA interferase RelE/StbE
MAAYKVAIVRNVCKKDLMVLSDRDFLRVNQRVAGLADDPRPAGSEKLVGRPGYRVRQGDYRIMYSIDDESRAVTVLEIGHRREVYER